MPENDALATAAQDLYAGPATTFVERRNAAAKAARAQGDAALARGISALRRPTASASVVNRLATEDLVALGDLAERLRAATTHPDAEVLKQLGAERSRLIAAILEKVEASPAVVTEVRATLTAALSDPQAEAAVRSRTLVRPLSYSGLGVADMQTALAVPTLRVVRNPQDLEDARTAVEVARRRRDAASEAATAAQAAFERAKAELEAARTRLQHLEA